MHSGVAFDRIKKMADEVREHAYYLYIYLYTYTSLSLYL